MVHSMETRIPVECGSGSWIDCRQPSRWITAIVRRHIVSSLIDDTATATTGEKRALAEWSRGRRRFAKRNAQRGLATRA